MTEPKDVQEHIDDCAAEALAALDEGNREDAIAGFIAGIRSHPQTEAFGRGAVHDNGLRLLDTGADEAKVRAWITGWVRVLKRNS